MTWWWTVQPRRARSERLSISELEAQSDWLSDVTWRLTESGDLCADFEIDRHGEPVPLTITYPSFFPDVPPQVKPRGEVRLSLHQYGAGCELCLEYRPDNWDPSITGAMMIESAYRLLVGETTPSGEEATVANAHRTTVGQKVRSSVFRFVLPQEIRIALCSVPAGTFVDLEVVENFTDVCCVAHLWRVGGEGEHWNAEGEIPKYWLRKGFFVCLDQNSTEDVEAEFNFIEEIVTNSERQDLREKVAQSSEDLVVIVRSGDMIKMMNLGSGSGKRKVYDYLTVEAPGAAERLPRQYGALASSSVAIVGCGSVGSKIAASLARSGVGKFVLVDGDVFFSGNVVRNDLDWRSVGLNKPDAVKARINLLNPSANVRSFRVELGGQESSARTDSILVAIGECDAIIDATAAPQVFNLCAAAARNNKKPLIWGEVFAGGIGGLIVRLLPGKDPVPHAARQQILRWCRDRGVDSPYASSNQYGLDLPDDMPPLIADDADVSVIAGHLTKMALDVLARDESRLVHSAYAIGLRAGWIFEAPFDTWPIHLLPAGNWGAEEDNNLSEELGALVQELFPRIPETGETE